MKVFHFMKVLLLLISVSLVSCAATMPDVAYVTDGDPLQKLDLYLPEGESAEARPVLIAIHGGGWAIGDKGNPGFVHPKFGWFKQHDFIVASINYRLSPAVSHPAHVEDVCEAIAWIGEHIAEHGGDPDRLYLIGHSAGAHLAALAAVDRDKLKAAGGDPEAIKGVILLDGAAYHVSRQIEAAGGGRMWINAFTDDPATQRDASPTLKVAKFDATPPPFLILHVATRPSSTEQSEGLARALGRKGGKATVVGIEGKNHMTINRDLGKPGDPTTEAVAEFLRLKPE